MRMILLTLFALTRFAAASFLEIRHVGAAGAGEGTQSFESPDGELLTVAPEVIASEQELAGVWAIQWKEVAMVLKFSEEGELKLNKMLRTKGETPKLAAIIDGKLAGTATVKGRERGGFFVIIQAKSLPGTEALADRLRTKIPSGTPEFFEIRRVVAPGQGKRSVKSLSSGADLTLEDTPIVTTKHLVGGSQVSHAKVGPSMVAITLNEEGLKLLKDATKNERAGQLRLAILVEGRAVAAPTPVSTPVECLVMELEPYAAHEIDCRLNLFR